jgi:hypothetical protein
MDKVGQIARVSFKVVEFDTITYYEELRRQIKDAVVGCLKNNQFITDITVTGDDDE